MVKILSKYDSSQYDGESSEEKMDIDDDKKIYNNINFNYKEISDKYYQEKIEPFIQQNEVKEDKTKSLD